METKAAVPKPPVLFWYNVYCALLAVTYVACAGLGVVFISFSSRLADEEHPAGFLIFMGILFLVMSIPFAAAFGAAPFLSARPWVWIYGLVLICIGMTSACCLPASVALLIFWLKPETKTYFGRA